MVGKQRKDDRRMIEKKIKFSTPEQILSFCATCQKMKSDIDIVNILNRHYRIDGKSIVGLMTIRLGIPMLLVVRGEDEHMAHEKFQSLYLE